MVYSKNNKHKNYYNQLLSTFFPPSQAFICLMEFQHQEWFIEQSIQILASLIIKSNGEDKRPS